MTTKEQLQGHWRKGKGDAHLERMVQTAQISIHFLLSAVLSGGTLFGVASPFGVAMVGASGAGLCGGASLVGAAFGYLSLHTFSQGLRYVSSCVLTFALWFCFYDWRLLRTPWVVAVLTTLINGGTSFVYLRHDGWTPNEVIFFCGEVVVTFVVTWGICVALLPLRLADTKPEVFPAPLSCLVFGCTLLVSLSGIYLWGDVSLGRMVGAVILLAYSWKQGSGVGAILGVICGLSLDLVHLDFPIYAMSWGFSAICGGVFQGKSRFHSGLAFFLANGTTVLWVLEDVHSAGILYEVFFATGIFFLVPEQWLAWCKTTVVTPLQKEGGRREVENIASVRKQLEDSATVFRLLGETLKTAFRPPDNVNDVAVVFDRTAHKVCQKCYLWNQCWEKEYVSTLNAMNDVSPKMTTRGKVNAEDFPFYFAHRCLHFSAFIEEVNLQFTGLLYRRQYNHRVRESRVAVCAQYDQLANLLSAASAQVSVEITPQLEKAKKLQDYLSYLGFATDIQLQENGHGLLEGEIRGEGIDCLETEDGTLELSQILKRPLGLKRKGNTLYIKELEPFMAVAGFSYSCKEGEMVSGDKSTYFKREDGHLFVLLCDGMGSGEGAKKESTFAVELLEQFLRAGIESLQALEILSSALSLRGEDTGGFTTVDLLEVNLLTGEATLFKYGAAPTYVKRGKEIKRLSGKSLPAGAEFGSKSIPDKIKLELEPEDCILMVSDGVSGCVEEDGWLCTLLQEFHGQGVKEFVRNIVAKTPDGNKDDRTAVLVRLALRELHIDG